MIAAAVPELPSARQRMLLIVVGIALAAASITPIRSYDYFWHLATGRWMWEHRALPLHDPFGLASAPMRWVDGEWLFQLLLYPIYVAGGHAAVAIVLGLGTGALFAAIFLLVGRAAGVGASLIATIAAWFGAREWLTARPSALAAALLVALIVVLRRLTGWRRALVAAGITVLWVNAHPSALLAPVVAALFELGERAEHRRTSSGAVRAANAAQLPSAPPFACALLAALALLVNPYGWDAVRAPLRLAAVVGEFQNAEWAPSAPAEFPLLYLLALGGLLLVLRAQRGGSGAGAAEALTLLLLTALAIRYCRNQGLYYAAWPLLVAPALPRLPVRIGIAVSAVAWAAVLATSHLGTGVDRKVPVAAVARLRASGLLGNVYTPYAFGGYLIWTFYPQRRVLTDGRNELYVEFEAEHQRALRDAARWRRLLARYDLRLAVFDYDRPPVQVIDPRTHRPRLVPAFALYFPRREWAPIAVDEVALVLARRDAFAPEVLRRLEIGPGPPPAPR